MEGKTELLVADDLHVRTITFNRPAKLNSFTAELFDQFRDLMVETALNDEVSCVILTGSGRSFCAGIDLHEIAAPTMFSDGKRHGFVPCIEEIERFSKPIVAAVNGLAVGFGATLLGHCDLVLASSDARFQLPFTRLGLAPEAGSSVTFPQLIGNHEAAYRFYSGNWFDAEEAVANGLVWRISGPEDLMISALTIAREIADTPLPSLLATKKLLTAARLEQIRSARARELEAYARLLAAPANRTAVAAFLQQRAE